MKSILLSSLALLLCACTSLVPSTALLVARLDPLTADPADLAAFLILPEGLALDETPATLTLAGVREDDGSTLSETVRLEAWQDGYRIAPADHARLRAAQSRLAEWKAGPGMSGSLSVAVSPCVTGPGPARDARYSVDILLERDGPRLPLLRNAPVADIGLADLKRCSDD